MLGFWQMGVMGVEGRETDHCTDRGDPTQRNTTSILEAGPEGRDSISELDQGSMNHLYSNNSFFCMNRKARDRMIQ